ncbi:hypothetical protein Dimus_015693, partial [Dionaea muscipula]
MGKPKREGAVSLEISMVLGVIAIFQPVCMQEVYKVGDSQGWTSIIPHPNYSQWAASKTFHIGDVIIFQYNRDFQNVMQVSRVEYKSCDIKDPIATYYSGNDSITIRSPGHYFYICSFPGHCQAGQKVDFRVLKTSSPVSPSASPSLSPTPSFRLSPVSAPSPAISGASSLSYSSQEIGPTSWILLAFFLLAVLATGSVSLSSMFSP